MPRAIAAILLVLVWLRLASLRLRLRIREVLANLVGDALRYPPAG